MLCRGGPAGGQKGGDYRLWYGNQEYVLNWEKDGWEMKNDNFDGDRCRAHNFNGSQQFKEGVTWNSISSSSFHCRYSQSGFTYDAAGPLCEVFDQRLFYVLGYMSSSVFRELMALINPTLNFPPGYIQAVPYINTSNERIESIVKSQIDISRCDWDSSERSIDYKYCSLI